MTEEQITAELEKLLAASYSRQSQRRIALLMGFELALFLVRNAVKTPLRPSLALQ